MRFSPDASLLCIYITLNQTYAMMRRCEVQLSEIREQRYVALEFALAQFLRTNGGKNGEWLVNAYGPQAARTVIENSSKACEGKTFDLATAMLNGLTSADGAGHVMERLETPEDPTKGACF